MRAIRTQWLALLLAALFVAPLQAAPDIVVLVRHAEKATDGGEDPALSDEGQVRALALADALTSSGITSVITTQFRRTLLTAAPLVERLGLQLRVVEAGAQAPAHIAELAQVVRSQSAGVLVVGHSNTVTALLRELGGPALPNLCESSFSHAFVLRLEPPPARVLHLRYGKDDPATGDTCL